MPNGFTPVNVGGETLYRNADGQYYRLGTSGRTQSMMPVAGVSDQSVAANYSMLQGATGGGAGMLSGAQLQNLSTNLANDAQLGRTRDEAGLLELEKEYADTPAKLRTEYGNMAKKAGTYAGTREFQVGLDSDVKAGARGARFGLSQRINALRRSLGREEFVPGEDEVASEDPTDAPNSTVGNETGDIGADAGSAETATNMNEDRTETTDAVGGVQSGTMSDAEKKRIAALKAAQTTL